MKQISILTNNCLKALNDIYGINGYKIEGLEIKEYKNNSKKQLNELLSKYESKKEDYLQEIKSIIKKVFEHKNCIIIDDTEQLRSLCMKRRHSTLKRKSLMQME